MNEPDEKGSYSGESQSGNGMQQLLDEADNVKVIRRGDVVAGVLVEKHRDGILVDVGSKAEGMVPPREMRSLEPQELEEMGVGDEVLVYVLQSGDAEEQALLSIDRAWGEKGWFTLQRYYESGDVIEGEVVDFNKGGLLVSIEGVRGFVPMSQLSGPSRREEGTDPNENPLAQFVGQSLKLKVIEINRRRNRAILSEKQVMREERERQREKVFAEIREGDVRKGRVTGIREFGAFVDIGGVDGLVHLSEFSWGQTEAPEKYVNVGDELDIYVLKVDHEAKKIGLSLRRLHAEPWETIHEKYHVGQLVTGTVTKITSFGAFARLDGYIEGLIHISELSDTPPRHSEDVVSEGDVLTLRILRIEPERRRLALSLKQALSTEEEASDKPYPQEETAVLQESPPHEETEVAREEGEEE